MEETVGLGNASHIRRSWVGEERLHLSVSVVHRHSRPTGDETGAVSGLHLACVVGTEVGRSLVRASPSVSRTRNP